MTRWYLDTEFNEDGRIIELISIALVADGLEGLSLYAINNEIDEARIRETNPWVGEHVLPKLPPRDVRGGSETYLDRHDSVKFSRVGPWRSRIEIRETIEALLLPDPDLEIWGYFSSYDWVVFCQLWGKMIDLPKGMPMFCHDLKQEMRRRGVSKDALPPQSKNAHDALEDARWIRDAHAALCRIDF